MSDPSQVWPPPPNPNAAAANPVPTGANGDRTTCPKCNRKLLTMASPFCNWCGERIDDDVYQARAAEARQSQDNAERAQLEVQMQEEARFGVIGRLKRRAKTNIKPSKPLF